MVVIETQGGLGNQLFQAGIAMEIEYLTNLRVCLDPWKHNIQGGRKFELPTVALGLDLVGGNRPLLTTGGLPGKFLRALRQQFQHNLVNEKDSEFDEGLLSPNKDSILSGYFQSWRYSDKSLPRMKETAVSLRAQSEWLRGEKARLDLDGPWFAVHVRRGDYLAEASRGIYGVPTVDYYSHASSIVRANEPSSRIVLFSDDPAGAIKDYRAIFKSKDLFQPMSAGTPLETLLLMGCGEGVVAANSTFSWWGARLAERINLPITVPRNWFLGSRGIPEGLVPLGWMSL